MQATMSRDVTDGVGIGAQALMKNMVLQSQCSQEIDLRSLRMDDGPGGSLFVTTKSVFTISENTLCFGLPHLVENGKWSPLADKMVGKKIVMHGSMHFVWDSASGRATRVQWKNNLLTPLLHLLGSLEDVSRVFDGARLSPESLIIRSDTLQFVYSTWIV